MATSVCTLSLHDALPICSAGLQRVVAGHGLQEHALRQAHAPVLGELLDRKSTRLNSSHMSISYAVFCLKKKNSTEVTRYTTSVYSDMHCCRSCANAVIQY